MQRLLLCAVLAAMLLCASSIQADESGFVFGVKPSQMVQSSFFGFQSGPIIGYFGLDYLGIGVSSEGEETDYWWDYSDQRMYRSHYHSWDWSGSATLIMPRIGGRLYLMSNDLGAYFFGELFKSFAFVNVDGKELDRHYNSDGEVVWEDRSDTELEDEEKEIIEELLGIWGVSLGFGAEYYFSSHFSIGGEYSFRWFHTGSDYEGEDSGSHGGEVQWREEWQKELSGSLGITQANVVLNFYFH